MKRRTKIIGVILSLAFILLSFAGYYYDRVAFLRNAQKEYEELYPPLLEKQQEARKTLQDYERHFSDKSEDFAPIFESIYAYIDTPEKIEDCYGILMHANVPADELLEADSEDHVCAVINQFNDELKDAGNKIRYSYKQYLSILNDPCSRYIFEYFDGEAKEYILLKGSENKL